MRLTAIASGIALATALGLSLGAVPANAAAGVGVVEVSNDGVSFSDSYPGVMFDDITLLVPGDSQNNTVYIRNSGDAAGYLRIILRDADYSDQKFADALTVTTRTAGTTGRAVAISSVNPCQVTHEGTLIEPGEVVTVLATLALGNLNGTDGQGATASFALGVTLYDATSGTLPATSCGTAGSGGTDAGGGTIIPGTPPTAGGTVTTGSLSTTGSSFVSVPNPGSHPFPATAEIVDEATGSGILRTLASTFHLDPNTWRLYQEYLVLILVLAAMTGAGISWIVGRRARRDPEHA